MYATKDNKSEANPSKQDKQEHVDSIQPIAKPAVRDTSVRPIPVRPIPAKPELVKPEPAKPEPAKLDTIHSATSSSATHNNNVAPSPSKPVKQVQAATAPDAEAVSDQDNTINVLSGKIKK